MGENLKVVFGQVFNFKIGCFFVINKILKTLARSHVEFKMQPEVNFIKLFGHNLRIFVIS
jgi:hypothetical protein